MHSSEGRGGESTWRLSHTALLLILFILTALQHGYGCLFAACGSTPADCAGAPPFPPLDAPARSLPLPAAIPYEDKFHAALRFLDRFIPPIKGRPFFVEIANNMKSGLTVALVSLPLSISLAIAADATPVQGIITACWAGGVSAAFGGSHYNVVGPTGALSGILSYYSVTYGSDIQPILAILTGIMCLGVYFSRLDKYLVFIPS